MKPGLDARRKLHQKVGIAASRIKISGPCRRAKHLQPLNTIALADGGNAGAVLGDGGVHWGKCTGGVFRSPATGAEGQNWNLTLNTLPSQSEIGKRQDLPPGRAR